MKKVASMLAVVAFLFTLNVNAQEPKPKKKKAKTEAASSEASTPSTTEKKSCSPASGKKGCCAHKEEAKS